MIAARGCRHRLDVHVTLAAGARLLLREEVLFGRYGEQPGSLRQRLRTVLGDHPLYDQQLIVGPAAVGWDGPAVTAGHRSADSLLVIDPGRDELTRHDSTGSDATVMALPGPGILISTLAADTTTLRRRLDATLRRVLNDDQPGGCGQCI